MLTEVCLTSAQLSWLTDSPLTADTVLAKARRITGDREGHAATMLASSASASMRVQQWVQRSLPRLL
jgi:hypothetical protein